MADAKTVMADMKAKVQALIDKVEEEGQSLFKAFVLKALKEENNILKSADDGRKELLLAGDQASVTPL